GKDRWYLEALGIGADLHWQERFDAWLKVTGETWNTPAGRDIVWGSRSAKTSGDLAQSISDASGALGEVPPFFRAFDFPEDEGKEDVLLRLLALEQRDVPRQQLIVAESAKRLSRIDAAKNPRYAVALQHLLNNIRGTTQFVELVDKLNLAPQYAELLVIAQKN